MDLLSLFNGVTDPRRAEGERIALPAFLWMSFLAIASSATGYRVMSRFARSNTAFFQQHFGLRHAMPSHVSFRSLLQQLDKEALYEAFNQAFSSHVQPGDWVAADGQCLCSTVRQAQTADQQFVSVVSLYCQRTGLTAALQDYTDKKSGEMDVLRQLLPLLQERGVVFTLDALHGQKKQPLPSSPAATTTCSKSKATSPTCARPSSPGTRPRPRRPGPGSR